MTRVCRPVYVYGKTLKISQVYMQDGATLQTATHDFEPFSSS